MAEMTADGANSIPIPPSRQVHIRVPDDCADADEATAVMQPLKFSGKTGTAVKLYMMVGLPTCLVFLGLYGGYRIYQDIAKPVVLQKIEQDKAITEHTITATQKMRDDSSSMSEMVTQQKLTNQHLETLGKSHEKMWQVMERMDRGRRGKPGDDEQGNLLEKPDGSPPGLSGGSCE